MLGKFGRSLGKTRKVFLERLGNVKLLFGSKDSRNDAFFRELEEALILADVGVSSAEEIIGELKRIDDSTSFEDALPAIIARRFPSETLVSRKTNTLPYIIMVVGVNGSGKTTTIAKLAHKEIASGGKVILAAADTFRAAAGEQLEHWAQVVGADIIRQAGGSDPAAVAFDAVKAGMARKASTVIIDTAGRLQTKSNLMAELQKIKRVIGNAREGAPDEILMVMDATTGQNAFSQIENFHNAVTITGIVVAKLDGTAKGGALVAAADKFKIPIVYVGTGEKPEDLVEFNALSFARGMVGLDE